MFSTSSYNPAERLDPRTKLLYGFAVSVLVIIVDNPAILVSMFVFTVAIWLCGRPKSGEIKLVTMMACVMILSTSMSQALFFRGSPRTMIATVLPADFPLLGRITGGLFVYREGFFYGIVQSFRYLAVMFAGFFTVRNTHTSELILGLTYFRVPQVFAFMVTIAIRSIPTLVNRTERILRAQQMRGLRTRGFWGMMRAVNYLLIPLIITTLRDIRQLGLAAEVRSYSGRRKPVRTLRFTFFDKVLLTSLIVAASLTVMYCAHTSSLNLGELF